MKQVGQYLIEGLISTGGMSTLYLGRHREMGRQVAIKQLHPHLARDQALVKRFEREAKILGGLRHHHIVDILDFFRHQDAFYIVLEYIEGRSLKDLLSARSPLPITAAANIGAQVARGLGYAHGRGVVHRDIKPANILFTVLGVAKIADFGLAFAKEALGLTDPGTFFGTPAYLAPEQIKGEKGDVRSDLFSFGVVLYEMLSGQNPFAGGTASDCMDRVLRHRPPKLSGLPPGLSRLALELLEKDPSRRPTSAVEAAERLEPYALITGEGVSRLLADPQGYRIRKEDQQALERISKRESRSQALFRFLTFAMLTGIIAFASWAIFKWGFPAAARFLSKSSTKNLSIPTDSSVVLNPPDTSWVGSLRLSGTSGARIYVNGRYQGVVPLTIEDLKPGRVLVRAEQDGFQTLEKTVVVQAREIKSLDIELVPQARDPGYLALAVLPWAEVYIDGRLIDRTPLPGPLSLESGKRQLLLRHPNRREYLREIEIKPGDTLRLEVTMPQAWGYLAVAASPWAEVFVDGEPAGTTPLADPIRLSIGQHEIRLEGPGGSRWRETVSLSEGETLSLRVDLR